MSFGGFIDFFQKGKVSAKIFYHRYIYITNILLCKVLNYPLKINFQTFRPKKKFSPGTLRYSLYKHAQASLNSGINLRSAVQLPPGEDLYDWIAVHGIIITF